MEPTPITVTQWEFSVLFYLQNPISTSSTFLLGFSTGGHWGTDPQVLRVLISLTITGYKCQVFLYGYTSAVRIEPITSRWLSPQNILEPICLTVTLLVFFVVYDSGLNYQPHFPLMHLSILLIAWPWIVWQGKTTVKLQIFYIYMYDIQ